MAVRSFEVYLRQETARRDLETESDEDNPAYQLWKYMCDLYGPDNVDHVSFYEARLHCEVEAYHSWFDTTDAPDWI